jgi:ABC-type dipeptide/oligopeptide/nickel transport system permease component
VAELGLDKPFFSQFFTFLGKAVQGEFGCPTACPAPSPS